MTRNEGAVGNKFKILPRLRDRGESTLQVERDALEARLWDLASDRSLDWTEPDFDVQKGLVCCFLSEKIYGLVKSGELKHPEMAKYVPSYAFQELVRKAIEGGALSRSDRKRFEEESIKNLKLFLLESGFEGFSYEIGKYMITITVRFAGAVFIVFRGTAGLHDCIVDAKLTKWDFCGGKAHLGFLQEVHLRLGRVLRKSKIAPETPVYLTGHSLGGAIASLSSIAMRSYSGHRVVSTYGFGAPRFGNMKLCKRLRHIYPVIRKGDPVPFLLPRRWEFEDAGELLDTLGKPASSSIRGGARKWFGRKKAKLWPPKKWLPLKLWPEHAAEKYLLDMINAAGP